MLLFQKIIEKQKQIEELLDEVFTDELKKLMEEFNKLAEKFDSKKMNELAKRMDLTYEDLQKQLDRNLEMLRKMKMEENIKRIMVSGKNMKDIELIKDVGRKVAEAHNLGVSLGDCKPENFIVTRDGFFFLDLEQANRDGNQVWDIDRLKLHRVHVIGVIGELVARLPVVTEDHPS